MAETAGFFGFDTSLPGDSSAWDEDEDVSIGLFADPNYPIVGFHGRTQDNRLVDLGVIWLDSKNEDCQERLPLAVQ